MKYIQASIMKGIIPYCFVALTTTLIFCLASCAPKYIADENDSQDGAPAFAFEWSPSSDCSVCHTDETHTGNGTLAEIHVDLETSCTDCHSDSDALTKLHQNCDVANLPSGLTETAMNDLNCANEACHNMTAEEFISLTEESTALIDDEGLRVNPHEVQTLTAGHIDAEMTCADCHPAHKNRDAIDYCLSCHHDGVFECGTCHA